MFGVGEAMLIAAALSSATAIGGGMMANSAREDAANSANKWGMWMQQGAQQHQNEMANFNANFNRQEAATARSWSEMMSNTAYQRAMADMRRSGLNPILAYQQGGASGGQAVSASTSNSGGAGFTPGARAEVQDVLGGVANSAMNAVRTIQGVQSAQEAIEQTRANTALQQVQAGREAAATGNLLQQTASEAERTGLISRQTATEAAREGLVQAQTGAASAQAGLASAQTDTERERRNEVFFRSDREQWQAQSARQEAERYESWGPRSQVTDAAASAEQIMRRTQRAMEQGLGPLLRVNQ